MATDDPPNDAPILPPRWRRLYARVISVELACPRCGRIHTPHPRTGGKVGRMTVYDRLTGIFTCPDPCGYRGYVGVLLWPARGRRARPEDQSPTPGEALRLRDAYSLSAATEERVAGTGADGAQTQHIHQRRRATVNMRCSCGEGCPVHAPGSYQGEGEDHETD